MATVAAAAVALATPAGAAVQAQATAEPRGTVRITNTNQSLTVGTPTSTVFTTLGGNAIRAQQWNRIGNTLVSRQNGRCMDDIGPLATQPCVPGKASQQWALKPAGPNQFRIQNFKTKRCIKRSAEVSRQLQGPAFLAQCKAERSQNWFVTQTEPNNLGGTR